MGFWCVEVGGEGRSGSHRERFCCRVGFFWIWGGGLEMEVGWLRSGVC